MQIGYELVTIGELQVVRYRLLFLHRRLDSRLLRVVEPISMACFAIALGVLAEAPCG